MFALTSKAHSKDMHAGGLVVDVEEVDELLDCIDTK
jgi:hypothetical protein